MIDGGHPGWPGFRDALLRAWADRNRDVASRLALVRDVVAQGRPEASSALSGGRNRDVDPGYAVGLPPELAEPEVVGLVLETLIEPGERRRRGAHHTPALVAASLVDLAVGVGGGSRITVPDTCDPAVGGGAFLLAVARRLVVDGHRAEDVLGSLHGMDIDPVAVEATCAALVWWGLVSGVDRDSSALTDVGQRVVVGDGLSATPASWGRSEGFDLVLGNPPFLGQMAATTARTETERGDLRERLGVDGYADSASLFLLTGLSMARPGGAVMMIQPESLLATRDVGPVRDRLLDSSELTDLWIAVDRIFGASVRVCAPVLVRRDGPVGQRSPGVRLWRGYRMEPAGRSPVPRPGQTWGALIAAVHGTPSVLRLGGRGQLGDIASVIAGFRDQFYGLVPHVSEGNVAAERDGHPQVALVTVGAIDPAWCSWGQRPSRFAKQTFLRPVVDLAALGKSDPGLDRWVRDRLVPKVLVATQTRVIEAVVDSRGLFVPSVPVIAVTPTPNEMMAGPEQSAAGLVDEPVWALASVLLAPPVSAWALQQSGGAALAGDSIKLSATQVRNIPLPVAIEPWVEAAAMLRSGDGSAREFGTLMLLAYGLASDDPTLPWWLDRLPSWQGEAATQGGVTRSPDPSNRVVGPSSATPTAFTK